MSVEYLEYAVSELPRSLGVSVDIEACRPLPELTAVLNNACDQIEDRQSPTIVVLRLGRVSPELRGWPGQVGIQDVNRWERALRRMEGLPAMNIALLAGTLGGPAFDVLLTADFRIATTDLVLLPPINDGHFWPGMAVHRLVQHLGLARARQIVMWGDDILAARAKDLGLVDQIVEDPADAAHTATVLMGRISDAELQVRRRLLLEAASASYEDALGVHLAACDRELRRIAKLATGDFQATTAESREASAADAGMTPGADGV